MKHKDWDSLGYRTNKTNVPQQYTRLVLLQYRRLGFSIRVLSSLEWHLSRGGRSAIEIFSVVNRVLSEMGKGIKTGS